MDNKLNKLIDDLLLQTLVKILEEADKTDVKFFPFLATACAKCGMPVVNIPKFLLSIADFFKNMLVDQDQEQSSKNTEDLQNLLSNSGLLTICFSQDQEEGDQ